jgi:hypothetical protein
MNFSQGDALASMPTLEFQELTFYHFKYHITPELRKEAERCGMPVLSYDGIAEIWVRTFQDWMDAVTDPTFAEQLQGMWTPVLKTISCVGTAKPHES